MNRRPPRKLLVTIVATAALGLAGGPALHNQASYAMVPGFQLVDRTFVLRWDATGHNPRHSLYRELLPAIPEILGEH